LGRGGEGTGFRIVKNGSMHLRQAPNRREGRCDLATTTDIRNRCILACCTKMYD